MYLCAYVYMYICTYVYMYICILSPAPRTNLSVQILTCEIICSGSDFVEFLFRILLEFHSVVNRLWDISEFQRNPVRLKAARLSACQDKKFEALACQRSPSSTLAWPRRS